MKTARKFTLNFVCFDCRASYGQPVLAHAGAAVRVCPTCRAPMTYVTPKYRPPRKADAKAWEVDRLLAKSNLLAYSPRFADGVPPALKVTRLAEAQDAIARQRPSFLKTLTSRKRLHQHWKKQGDVKP